MIDKYEKLREELLTYRNKCKAEMRPDLIPADYILMIMRHLDSQDSTEIEFPVPELVYEGDK